MIVGRSDPSDGHSCAASTLRPSTNRVCPSSARTSTLPSRNVMIPARSGPARNSISFCGDDPKLLSPSLRKKSPMSVSQPSSALSRASRSVRHAFDFCRVVARGRCPACQQHRKKRDDRCRQSGCHLRSPLPLVCL